MLNLKTVKVHNVRGSYFIYLPIVWAKEMGIEKGDKVKWFINEDDHETLHLKKEHLEG